MKNLLGKMAVIGSAYVAAAFGSDLTNQPSNNTTSHLESLRTADRANQEKLGHATNVWVYNSKTGKTEKKQTWARPDNGLVHKTSLGGIVLGPNTGKYDSIFVGPIQVNVPSKDSARTNDQIVYIGGVPVGFNSNGAPYFVTNTAPLLLKGLQSEPLSDAEMSKIRGSPNKSTK